MNRSTDNYECPQCGLPFMSLGSTVSDNFFESLCKIDQAEKCPACRCSFRVIFDVDKKLGYLPPKYANIIHHQTSKFDSELIYKRVERRMLDDGCQSSHIIAESAMIEMSKLVIDEIDVKLSEIEFDPLQSKLVSEILETIKDKLI